VQDCDFYTVEQATEVLELGPGPPDTTRQQPLISIRLAYPRPMLGILPKARQYQNRTTLAFDHDATNRGWRPAPG
jgi:hypothetical protein